MTSTVQASAKMLDLVEQWADSCIKSAEIVDRLIKQATEEGLAASDCRELLESALQRRGLKKRQIYNLIPDAFKRHYEKSSSGDESAMNAQSENPTSQDEDIATLKTQFEAIQNEVSQLRRLLVPFRTATRVNIRGFDIPVILEIDPQSKKVLSAEVDEAQARRIFGQ